MKVWNIYIKDDSKIWDIITSCSYINKWTIHKLDNTKILWTDRKGRLVLLDMPKWVF